MKITKQQLKQIIKEEVARTLSEIEGLTPKEFGDVPVAQALDMARQQQKDPYSTMSCGELEKIVKDERAMADYDSLKKLTSAYNAGKRRKCDFEEDAELEKDLETTWQQYERSPGHGRVGGKY